MLVPLRNPPALPSTKNWRSFPCGIHQHLSERIIGARFLAESNFALESLVCWLGSGVAKRYQNRSKEGPDGLWNRGWARERFEGPTQQQNFGNITTRLTTPKIGWRISPVGPMGRRKGTRPIYFPLFFSPGPEVALPTAFA